ncbi:nicotinate phosphoribosyltransferase [Candidatus Omnitrophota bacterium]
MAADTLRLDSGLWLDLYELAMAQVYFKYKPDQVASFELFIRSRKRPFYIAYGIREALEHVAGLRFSQKDIDYLKTLGLFEASFLKYLKSFSFKADVWAVDEPEIIFAQEPILRVTADLIQAQIVESSLLNIINLHTTLATKAQRVVMAAKARKVYDFSLRRTQGLNASLAAAKASYVCGVEGTSNVAAAMLYGIPAVGTMAHSYVMSFSSEFDSFHAFARTFPQNAILLIDTYDIKKALDQVVKVAKLLKGSKRGVIGVRIDSGDLAAVSKYVRARLDTHDLIDVTIFASGNLDEYRIKELSDKNAPIDAFGVGTNMGTSADIPYSDVIYKLIEVRDLAGKFMPVMKFSQDKITFPLSKQVFRKASAKSGMKQDLIALFGEKGRGKPLLKKVMAAGQMIDKKEDLINQRRRLEKKIEGLPAQLKEIDSGYVYPVSISPKLEKATRITRSLIEKRSGGQRIVFFDIDTQFDFAEKKGALYVKDSEKLKNLWATLTKYALANQITLVSSQDLHKKNDPEFKTFPAHCLRGSRGSAKLAKTLLAAHTVLSAKELSFEELFRIKENFQQIILEKGTLDVFSNPNTAKLFEAVRPDAVYVYGLATEFCVKQACLGLARITENVFVVEDAIKEVSREGAQKAFAEFKRKGVKTVKAHQVLVDR